MHHPLAAETGLDPGARGGARDQRTPRARRRSARSSSPAARPRRGSPTTASPPIASPSSSPAPIPRRWRGDQRAEPSPALQPSALSRQPSDSGAPLRRDADAAQGLRAAAERARRDPAAQLAADVRRQPRPRSARRWRACARSCATAGSRIACRSSATWTRAALGRAVRPRRPVRAADAVRRLRHGGRRSARARAAGRQHGDRRHSRIWCVRRSRTAAASSSRPAICRRSPTRCRASIGDARSARAARGEGARRVRERLPTWERRGRGDGRGARGTCRGDGAADERVQRRVAGAARAGRSCGAIDATSRARSLDDAAAAIGRCACSISAPAPAPTCAIWRRMSRGPGAADWLLVDHDPALLARGTEGAADVETRCMDLATLDDPTHLRRPCARDRVGAARSRVRDDGCGRSPPGARRRGAAVLFALTYDGRIGCSPEDPDDGLIVALVNEHQRTDKGFGPALGPDAHRRARRAAFEQLGYRGAAGAQRLDAGAGRRASCSGS